MFIASNVEKTKIEGNNKFYLIRYEFFEALIRIADMKYK